ncbi:MAG: hypothetical protein ACXWSD_19595, partial [Bdellovibrionota bacterium]
MLLMLALSAGLLAFSIQSFNAKRASLGLIPPCLLVGEPFHHKYQPNCEGQFHVSKDLTVHYQFNSAGVREREEPSPGRHVLLAGDSDVEGQGLEFEETLSQRLGKRFPAQGSFINGGIRFTGPVYERLQIRRLVSIYQPHSLLWFLCENDINDDRLFEALTTKRDPNGIPEQFS